MKKILVALLCIIWGGSLLVGCSTSNTETFTKGNYTAKVDEVNEVKIDVEDRQIEVGLSKDNNIYIDYYESPKEGYDISVSNENVLTMINRYNKEISDYFGLKTGLENRIIKLKVPKELISSLVLVTTNADILLPKLNITDNLLLDSEGGNISFEGVAVGKSLIINSKNGNVDGTIAGNYEDFAIINNSKKGKTNLPENKEGGSKELNVTNNNGDVNIGFSGI